MLLVMHVVVYNCMHVYGCNACVVHVCIYVYDVCMWWCHVYVCVRMWSYPCMYVFGACGVCMCVRVCVSMCLSGVHVCVYVFLL